MKELEYIKGIVVMRLIIIFIVSFILISTTINFTIGENGIVEKAINARKIYNITSAMEQLELEVASLASDYYEAKYIENILGSEDTVKSYILNELYTIGQIDNYKLKTDKTTGRITLTANDEIDGESVEGVFTDDGRLVFNSIIIGK